MPSWMTIVELMYRDRKMPEPLLQVYPKLVEAVEKMGKLHFRLARYHRK